MPSLQRVAGIAFLQVDGKMLSLQGAFLVGQSRIERDMIFGQEGLAHGYLETFRAPFVEGELTLPLPGIDLEILERQTDVTINVQFGGGLHYVLRNAICKGGLDAQARDGKVLVRWEGMQCIELRPGQPDWPEDVVKDDGLEPEPPEEPELFVLGESLLGGPDVLG
jgi:hypothetical protein